MKIFRWFGNEFEMFGLEGVFDILKIKVWMWDTFSLVSEMIGLGIDDEFVFEEFECEWNV